MSRWRKGGRAAGLACLCEPLSAGQDNHAANSNGQSMAGACALPPVERIWRPDDAAKRRSREDAAAEARLSPADHRPRPPGHSIHVRGRTVARVGAHDARGRHPSADPRRRARPGDHQVPPELRAPVRGGQLGARADAPGRQAVEARWPVIPRSSDHRARPAAHRRSALPHRAATVLSVRRSGSDRKLDRGDPGGRFHAARRRPRLHGRPRCR
jgi:hypothetical protein